MLLPGELGLRVRSMKTSLLRLCIMLAAPVLAAPSLACRTSAQMRSFLFNSDPGPSDGAVAAKVQIVQVPTSATNPSIRANVIQMLRGPYRAMTVTITPISASTCDMPPRVGQVGIVVGNVRGFAHGELSVDAARSSLGLTP